MNNEVKHLIARVTSNREQQAKEKANQLLLATKREISDATPFSVQNFWCNCCARDYTTTGRLIVEGQGQQASAVYASQCPEGHANYRYITDQGHDPYWMRSHKVQADRDSHELDMISPHDSRFKTIYRTQWLQHEDRREVVAREESAQREK